VFAFGIGLAALGLVGVAIALGATIGPSLWRTGRGLIEYVAHLASPRGAEGHSTSEGD
jgi:hypothetical protein